MLYVAAVGLDHACIDARQMGSLADPTLVLGGGMSPTDGFTTCAMNWPPAFYLDRIVSTPAMRSPTSARDSGKT